MGRATTCRRLSVGLVAMVAAIGLAACGGSSKSTSTTASGGGSTTSANASSASMQRARAGIAALLEHPTPIPVTEPLKKLPPKGKTIAFMNCGDPECQEYWPGIQAAAKALGYVPKEINSGLTPQTVTAAFDTAAQLHPAGIIDPGIDPYLFKQPLKTLKAAGIPVVAIGISEPAGNGITSVLADGKSIVQAGQQLADYVYTRQGDKAKAVFVDVPEIQLSVNMGKSFVRQLKSLCATCSATTLSVPASSIGTKLPSREVSYLQQHPDDNWLVNFSGGLYIGVPQALKAAGIKVNSLSQSGGPVNMQYLKSGLQTADLTFDFSEWGWLATDMIARENTGQGIAASEQGSVPPAQLLTQKDITFDPSHGFVAYADYPSRYKKLWGVTP